MAELLWDTSGVCEADRWLCWRQAVRDTFLPVTLTRTGDGPFAGSMRVAQVGGLGVSQIRSAPQSVQRTSADILRRAGDAYFLQLPLAGGGSTVQDGRVADLSPGDFAIVDGDVPFELHYGEMFHQVSLTIPRRLLAPLLAEPEGATGVRVRGDRGVGAVASSAIRAMAEQASSLDPGAARTAAGHVAGLVALAVGELAVTTRSSASRRMVLRAATNEIAASYADPGLTPTLVAAQLAISVRYLHRVFSDDGTTFGRVLLRHRLEAARRALEDPAFARVTITDLALRNGFADPTHFGRAFKAAYGRTPLSHRRESLRAATQCA